MSVVSLAMLLMNAGYELFLENLTVAAFIVVVELIPLIVEVQASIISLSLYHSSSNRYSCLILSFIHT